MARVIPLHACPACKEKQRVPIVYGYPGEELAEAARRGEAVLGGCVVTDNLPLWSCPRCGHRWGKLRLQGPRRRSQR